MLNMRQIDDSATTNSEEDWSQSLLQFRIPHCWTTNMDSELIFDEDDGRLGLAQAQEHENNILKHLSADVEASHSLSHGTTTFHQELSSRETVEHLI